MRKIRHLLVSLLTLTALMWGTAAWAQVQTYTKITSDTELVAGAKYLLVGYKSEDPYAMGLQNSNNRASVQITETSGSITVEPATLSDDTKPFEITLEGTTDAWNLFDAVNGTYLRPRTGKYNGLQGQATTSNANWTISIAPTGEVDAVCENTTIYERNILRFNASNNPPLFACYGSGQTDVYLFRLEEGQDNDPPVPTFFPEDNATNVAIDVNPTITFDEVIYTAGVEVDDTNVEGLISLKAGATDVAFTATIAGKVITVVPDAELDYSTEYTLTVAKVEDAKGNIMDNDASVSFTTLADTDPVLNLTGNFETIYYQGGNLTVTWQAKNIDKVKVEVWLPTDPAQWMNLADEVDAADGEFSMPVHPTSPFSKAYKLRITGTTVGDPFVETPEFTIREVYTKLTDILGKELDTEFRYDGEAVVTHKRDNRNQKYIQDDFGAMLIDDAGGVITSAYTVGSAITGLVAKVGDFNGLTQIIPLADPGAPVSEGNEVLPVEMALTDIGPEHQSMLVELSNITFESTGTFAGNSDYVIKDADGNTFAYRTVFTEADYIGTDIPTQRQSKLVGIVVKFHETMQFAARSLADFNAVTDASMQWDAQLSVYPNPFSHMLRIENVDNAMRVVVSNLLGQTVLNVELGGANQAEINTEALQSGVYLVTVINGNGERAVRRMVKR